MPTLKELTTVWLKENGYDGLFQPDICPGCFLDDLMPCYSPFQDCKPGYEWKSIECDDVWIYSEKQT